MPSTPPDPICQPIPQPAWRRLLRDPRHYQIFVLGSLLVYGIARLDLEVRAAPALVMAATALLTQWAGAALAGQRFEARSACISALSLCLLLRTGSVALAAAAAMLAVGSKFVLRVRGKHVWNPTNFGIVALLLAGRGEVWVSPGQWGSTALFGFLLLCLGGMVVHRAARADVTWAFLASYGSLLGARALWLGQPWSVPWHQMSSGAFLIFAFFMISDPRSTPDSRAGRILFAALVAVAAGWAQFALYRPTGLLLALAFLAPLVPVLDLLLPGSAYRWPRPVVAVAARSFA
jgi:enediyne biosynthesis protein E5